MTTWFVRHSTAHGATRNGASYATAWGTFSEVVWGGAGVVAGDTLYVCGAHTTKLTIGANGNASNRIAVDFRYSADPGSIDGGGAVSPLITANIRSYFDIIGPTLTDPTSGTTASHIYMDRCRHITVRDAVINGVTANVARGIVIRSGNTTSGNYGTFDVEVSGCAISDLNGDGDIMLLVASRADADDPEGNLGMPYDIRIRNNTITGCTGGIRKFDAEAAHQQVNDLRPYGVVIDGNTIVDCLWGIWQMGWKDDASYPSRITNNHLHNIGDSAVSLINCIQLERARGGIVSGNVVTNVLKLGDGDGHGIMLDYAYDNTDAAYFTDGVTVRGNVLSGALSNSLTAGIKVWRGTNNIIEGNYVYNCSVGVGCSYAGSTGNTFRNNTTDADIAYNLDQGSAAVTMVNNVGVGASKGIQVSASTDPVESYSVISAPANDVTLGTGSVSADPVIDTAGRPLSGSPCIAAGLTISGLSTGADGRRFMDPPTIGGYESGKGAVPIRVKPAGVDMMTARAS